jgi:hypothetical protein
LDRDTTGLGALVEAGANPRLNLNRREPLNHSLKEKQIQENLHLRAKSNIQDTEDTEKFHGEFKTKPS